MTKRIEIGRLGGWGEVEVHPAVVYVDSHDHMMSCFMIMLLSDGNFSPNCHKLTMDYLFNIYLLCVINWNKIQNKKSLKTYIQQ